MDTFDVLKSEHDALKAALLDCEIRVMDAKANLDVAHMERHQLNRNLQNTYRRMAEEAVKVLHHEDVLIGLFSFYESILCSDPRNRLGLCIFNDALMGDSRPCVFCGHME